MAGLASRQSIARRPQLGKVAAARCGGAIALTISPVIRNSLVSFLVAFGLSSCGGGGGTDVGRTPTAAPELAPALARVIPKPQSVTPGSGTFTLAAGAKVYVDPSSPEVTAIAQYLADKLNPATGFGIRVASAAAPPAGSLQLTTLGADPSLGEEGYVLTITPTLVSLQAAQPAGLFRGIQTIRQLLPAAVESASPQAGPWTMPAGTIRDYPRFAWRGAMLDVARHFFGPADVERYVDLLAYYKINRFHLHLTDDQGWRIAIDSWPNLATHGGSTAVGGGPGGYYTRADYERIVAFAARRYVTVVPEIDMPGHTNAALASYPSLNCDGVAPALYTGIAVGFSSLCTTRETTYAFVTDVLREVAGMTPGPYVHIGGDEARSTAVPDYAAFIDRVRGIAEGMGKQVIGWEEIGKSHLSPTAIAQYWSGDGGTLAASQGARFIVSPANRAYLDMKYDSQTALGQNWAGYVDVKDAYSWEPTAVLSGVPEANILGVEAPLWTETLQTRADLEYMAFPRLSGVAEIGWSARGQGFDEYKLRLAGHGPRLAAMGVNFYRTPQVPWN
jgi:hexosaminidase